MKAYRNAKHDPRAARNATFAQAESFLSRSGYGITAVGGLRVDENIHYIYNRMGISEDDIRFWTINLGPNDNREIRAVYVAANLNPNDMSNHIIMTTALQFELDRLREAGRLGSEVITALIQYRDLTVELEYKNDGRFTPVLRNPLSGKRLKFDPLERMVVQLQEDGVPLVLPETSMYAVRDVDIAKDEHRKRRHHFCSPRRRLIVKKHHQTSF